LTHTSPAVQPGRLPGSPCFSSGPCAKRPGWSPQALAGALVGRSHRSSQGRARLNEVIERTRALLALPEGYRVAVVPASDTGAFEMALWSLLGARGVDAFAWESFGKGWVTDITKQLRLKDVRVFEADYGELPDLGQADDDRDVVFTWNGTTSGVCVPNGDWLAPDRAGLAICDATSAVFAMELPFAKLDVVTYSWQKVMGGEAAHGMLILSPRAVQRLESYAPPWPLPKVFRMTKQGKLDEALFRGDTINTPSMLCVEDALDALRWLESIGGAAGAVARSRANLKVMADWAERTPWLDFLARQPAWRSSTSICFRIADPWYTAQPADAQSALSKKLVGLLEKAGAAFDVGAYRDAPPGLRVWGGATVEAADLELLTPWLDWAFASIRALS
jgi:phosphoserine aminotransferase